MDGQMEGFQVVGGTDTNWDKWTDRQTIQLDVWMEGSTNWD